MSTVALTIDYSNGAQKHFSSIPWKKDLTILGAIQGSQEIPPGATSDSDLIGQGTFSVLVIDDMPRGETRASDWVVWVNAKPFQSRLGTETSFGFHPLNARETFSIRVTTC